MSGEITYLVEILNGKQKTAFQSTSVDIHAEAGGAIVHVIDTTPPEAETYWTDWGGTYDNLETTFVLLYFETFLKKVDTLEELKLVQNSMFVDGYFVYFRTPRFPWQYKESLTSINYQTGYSSNVSDTRFPSDDFFGDLRYPVRLKVPSVMAKLPDPINGLFLTPTFSLSFINNDGLFDGEVESLILNTPVTLKKSRATPATLDTFNVIKRGFVENTYLDLKDFRISCADTYRTLDEPLCRTLSEGGFVDVDDPDELMPVAYGPHFSSKLIRFKKDGDVYLCCDPEYLQDVSTVYDKDGEEVNFLLLEDGTIVPETEAATCDFTGSYPNSLADIIINELTLKSLIPYTESNWNVEEVDIYRQSDPLLSIFRDGGKVKDIVNDCTGSDSAFLIQQHSGRFTIRVWGGVYGQHEIPSWMITKTPTKKHTDHKYFYSSVLVKYGLVAGELENQILYDLDQEEAFETWRKLKRGVFKTFLVSYSAALAFAGRVSFRFSRRAEEFSLSVGAETSGIELLDSVKLQMSINRRIFSKKEFWITTGVDPAQDKLVFEENTRQMFGESGLLSEPSTEADSGLLSEPSTETDSGLLSEPFSIK